MNIYQKIIQHKFNWYRKRSSSLSVLQLVVKYVKGFVQRCVYPV